MTPEPSDSSSSTAPEPSGSTPSETPTTSLPPGDTVAPTGTYKLSATSIWTGQFVKLTQTAADFNDVGTPDAAIARIVSWGDGSRVDTLKAGQTVAQHVYTRPGTYTVNERLTDPAGNAAYIRRTVKVSNAWTKLVNSKSTVWPGQRYTLTVKSVPAGTQSFVVDNGDNCTVEYKWTGKARAVPMIFWKDCKTGRIVTGKRYAKIKYKNANGYSVAFSGPAVTVKKDSWKPKVTVTKPSSSNRLKSWKYVTGTAKDTKGSGVRAVWVFLENYSGGKDYCMNKNKKWQRVTEATWDDVCYGWRATLSSNGKFKFKVPAGLKKGYFWASARSEDWGGQLSPWKTLEVKITRS
ncbi:hypothetical protein Ate01nite_09770 [Actinoplanes teichomyceticus]|nr:hypothetical protein Ate01nite_09770 [Actinoplanes teichomyceticus]